MATAKFFDNYSSTLSGSYTSGGTSLAITAAGSGATALPATAGDYYLVVDPGTASEEVFKVTARSTLTLTVVGAQAGTSAANHSSGAIIKGPIWTANGIAQLRADMLGVTTWSARPTVTTGSPAHTYFTDSPYSLIDNGSSLYTMFQGEIITPIDSSLYSWVNQIGASESFANGYAALTSNAGIGNNVVNCAIRVKTAPSTPYSYALKFGNVRKALAGVGYLSGILFRNSSTGKWTGLYQVSTGLLLQVSDFNSATAFSANVYNDTAAATMPFIWMRIADDGTNKTYSISSDGYNFFTLFSRASATFAGTTDQVGYFVDAEITAPGTVETQIYAVR